MNFPNLRGSNGQLQIRWLIRRDMPAVLEIEQASFQHPWSNDDFIRCLRLRNCIGMVAERDGQIIGYMIYELHKSRLHVMHFAVAPAARTQGVGSRMIERLVDKLSQQRRKEIVIELRESNLQGQLFFQRLGFVAVAVIRDRFDDTSEDAYIMRFVLEEESQGTIPFSVQQRLGDYDYFSDAA